MGPRSGSLEALGSAHDGSVEKLVCTRDRSSQALECTREKGTCEVDSSTVLRKRIERRLSVVTVETVDLDCQFIRPDLDDQEDKIIEEEKAETGRVGLWNSFSGLRDPVQEGLKKKTSRLYECPIHFHRRRD